MCPCRLQFLALAAVYSQPLGDGIVVRMARQAANETRKVRPGRLASALFGRAGIIPLGRPAPSLTATYVLEAPWRWQAKNNRGEDVLKPPLRNAHFMWVSCRPSSCISLCSTSVPA